MEGDLEPKLEHYGTSKQFFKNQEDFKFQFKGSYSRIHHVKLGKEEKIIIIILHSIGKFNNL